MSMDHCATCGDLVDTDDDTEFYYLNDRVQDAGLCEHCRDAYYTEQEREEIR